MGKIQYKRVIFMDIAIVDDMNDEIGSAKTMLKDSTFPPIKVL